jgi:hypothetical protein
VKNTALTTTLLDYVKNTALTTTLLDYVKKMKKPLDGQKSQNEKPNTLSKYALVT